MKNNSEPNIIEVESNCEESDEELDVRQQTESSDNYSETESIIGEKTIYL